MPSKICPLQFIFMLQAYKQSHGLEEAGCIEDKCAWWTPIGCGVVTNAWLQNATVKYEAQGENRTTTITIKEKM